MPTYSSGIDQNAADGAWNQTYGPGGLRDIRQLQDSLTAKGAIHWRGQTRVLEALYMGTAADIWGSVPYSEAITHAGTPPTFDTQAQVYAHVLAVLDSAITDLASTDTKLAAYRFLLQQRRHAGRRPRTRSRPASSCTRRRRRRRRTT